MLDVIRAAARDRGSDEPERRRDLHAQLDRLRDPYIMGDLTKSQYVMRRQALEEEVGHIGPPVDADIAKAEALLDIFAQFWALEVASAERRKLLVQLSDRAWQDDGTIVAVKPRAPFARYFATVAGLHAEKETSNSERSFEVSKAGATGLGTTIRTPESAYLSRVSRRGTR